MHDDEKMFNIGVAMLMGMFFVIGFLQVSYRVQNSNLKSMRQNMETTKYEMDIAKTKLSALSSADSLRSSVIGINPKAKIVSFSQNVHIDNIPMVQENAF